MSFIDDILSLEVVTVTGDVTVNMEKMELASADNKALTIGFDKLFKGFKGDIMTIADLKVIAASKIQADKDTYTFVAQNLEGEELNLVEMHYDTVSAALESRAAIAARFKVPFLKGGDAGDQA